MTSPLNKKRLYALLSKHHIRNIDGKLSRISLCDSSSIPLNPTEMMAIVGHRVLDLASSENKKQAFLALQAIASTDSVLAAFTCRNLEPTQSSVDFRTKMEEIDEKSYLDRDVVHLLSISFILGYYYALVLGAERCVLSTEPIETTKEEDEEISRLLKARIIIDVLRDKGVGQIESVVQTIINGYLTKEDLDFLVPDNQARQQVVDLLEEVKKKKSLNSATKEDERISN